MDRHTASSQGHWTEFEASTQSQAVRCGEMVFVSGQMDVDKAGKPLHPGDPAAEAQGAVARLAAVLGELELGLGNVTKLLCFYVNDGTRREADILLLLAAALPHGLEPAVTAVPVPYLACEGANVMLDAYAMARSYGGMLPRQSFQPHGAAPLPKGFATAVRCGKMIFVSGQSPVVDVTSTCASVAFTKEMLESVPRGRDLQNVLAMAPGVTQERLDVGGSTLAQRCMLWVAATRRVAADAGMAGKRSVVFDDGAQHIVGALLGERNANALVPPSPLVDQALVESYDGIQGHSFGVKIQLEPSVDLQRPRGVD